MRLEVTPMARGTWKFHYNEEREYSKTTSTEIRPLFFDFKLNVTTQNKIASDIQHYVLVKLRVKNVYLIIILVTQALGIAGRYQILV